MILSKMLSQLCFRQGRFTDVALGYVEGVDGLEMYGENTWRAELLLAVTADVALLTNLVLADCLGAQVTAELPQTGDLARALTLAELVVVVSDEVGGSVENHPTDTADVLVLQVVTVVPLLLHLQTHPVTHNGSKTKFAGLL